MPTLGGIGAAPASPGGVKTYYQTPHLANACPTSAGKAAGTSFTQVLPEKAKKIIGIQILTPIDSTRTTAEAVGAVVTLSVSSSRQRVQDETFGMPVADGQGATNIGADPAIAVRRNLDIDIEGGETVTITGGNILATTGTCHAAVTIVTATGAVDMLWYHEWATNSIIRPATGGDVCGDGAITTEATAIDSYTMTAPSKSEILGFVGHGVGSDHADQGDGVSINYMMELDADFLGNAKFHQYPLGARHGPLGTPVDMGGETQVLNYPVRGYFNEKERTINATAYNLGNDAAQATLVSGGVVYRRSASGN